MPFICVKRNVESVAGVLHRLHRLPFKLLASSSVTSFRQLEPLGLTPFHWVVLCCLWEEDEAATSGIETVGYLNRRTGSNGEGASSPGRDAHDRRIWRIWLTEEGKQLKRFCPPWNFESRR